MDITIDCTVGSCGGIVSRRIVWCDGGVLSVPGAGASVLRYESSTTCCTGGRIGATPVLPPHSRTRVMSRPSSSFFSSSSSSSSSYSSVLWLLLGVVVKTTGAAWHSGVITWCPLKTKLSSACIALQCRIMA